jgi:hypothetical protein
MKIAKKTKSKAGQTYHCCRCADPIVAGQEYLEWIFYRCTPTRQHALHGAPRQSQLTRSRMSQVYGAVESAEDAIVAARQAVDISGLPDTLRSCAEEVENARQEYEDGLGNMPDSLQSSSSGEAIQEKIDGLQEFHDALESAADEIESLVEELDGLEEPNYPAEHGSDCPAGLVECGELEEGECECGHDEGEEAQATYESEQERIRGEAFDAADNALSELTL